MNRFPNNAVSTCPMIHTRAFKRAMDTELTDFHQQKALGTMSLYCITSLSAVGCVHETMSLYFLTSLSTVAWAHETMSLYCLTSLSAVGCAHEAMYCLTSLSAVG